MSVTRYDEWHTQEGSYMTPVPNGDWIKFDDYEKLKKRRDDLLELARAHVIQSWISEGNTSDCACPGEYHRCQECGVYSLTKFPLVHGEFCEYQQAITRAEGN
jgi:hypothetical protein